MQHFQHKWEAVSLHQHLPPSLQHLLHHICWMSCSLPFEVPRHAFSFPSCLHWRWWEAPWEMYSQWHHVSPVLLRCFRLRNHYSLPVNCDPMMSLQQQLLLSAIHVCGYHNLVHQSVYSGLWEYLESLWPGRKHHALLRNYALRPAGHYLTVFAQVHDGALPVSGIELVPLGLMSCLLFAKGCASLARDPCSFHMQGLQGLLQCVLEYLAPISQCVSCEGC